ncbi:hypothetical protein HRG_006122 [Hirsutella rhossiliensis]|uniref:Uncharacterized protein n=1 Tax=Hirsutella rhossiliensis TaxID=111463 RepID=A0A9P8N2P6_9HYPO|nr:uncharacterized protein HRG_06122 [Hirsutella rhossiliensis]KAH0963612.1 hypothetical protein HRG_06122 [Hirsutella rhossiliensis]
MGESATDKYSKPQIAPTVPKSSSTASAAGGHEPAAATAPSPASGVRESSLAAAAGADATAAATVGDESSRQAVSHYPKRKRACLYNDLSESKMEISQPTSTQLMAVHQARFPTDPLPGTRPTRILLGYWKQSSEPDPRGRHAIYGILGHDDKFRVKVVRETRDGHFVDGNFPSGAGALWIPYGEVVFENHLKALNKQEVKEYCRIRQYQLDHGEIDRKRNENETRAVHEAKTRARTPIRQTSVAMPTFSITRSANVDMDRANPRTSYGGGEPGQSRRIDPRADGRTPRQFLNENELSSAQLRQRLNVIERTSTLARRELARAEAAQDRADRLALTRERAFFAAANNAVAIAAPASAINGRTLHESEDTQHVNKVWAHKESFRMKAYADDAKMYDGVKYERKSTGPFTGKFVSRGTIVHIDGEDYVEYRVLTKPF